MEEIGIMSKLEVDSNVRHEIHSNGLQKWFIDERLHRTNGPAIIHPSGKMEFYNYGTRHRDYGLPSIIHPNGAVEFWENDVLINIRPFEGKDPVDEGACSPKNTLVKEANEQKITVSEISENIRIWDSVYVIIDEKSFPATVVSETKHDRITVILDRSEKLKREDKYLYNNSRIAVFYSYSERTERGVRSLPGGHKYRSFSLPGIESVPPK